ncbi:hypothetical protein D3C83_148340 [compost metagenome]
MAPKASPASCNCRGTEEMPRWVRRIGAGMTKTTVEISPGTMPRPKKTSVGIR